LVSNWKGNWGERNDINQYAIRQLSNRRGVTQNLDIRVCTDSYSYLWMVCYDNIRYTVRKKMRFRAISARAHKIRI